MAAAGAFTVTVYSGTEISDANPILFTTTVAGQPADLYAVADPERLLPELDEANNVAVAR